MEKDFTSTDFIILIGYAIALAGGQVLFKFAATQQQVSGSLFQRVVGIAFSPSFMAAIILYATLSALWVWLLTTVPLSRAYPFVALSLVLTLMAGVFIFGEPFSARLLTGGALIVSGLLVITG